MRLLLPLAVFAWMLHGAMARAADRPNILWLTAEDMSPQLGCYGDAEAKTPRLDAFAKESVRYTEAFATAPVCSPARSTLITGMYATSLGTQRLRSEFPIPAEVRPFPAYLREAGYYCTNNVKTDYNLRNEAAFIKAAWDESSARAHWRGRKADQTFFSVVNFMTTHQSRASVWPEGQFEREVGAKLLKAERADPERLSLPPFYPETGEARRAWARYRDCVTLLDRQVGEILDQLAADGLAENTIVFFFSDHGMGMPRGKRTLYDSGMRVPLLARFPAKWAHLATGNPGTVSERLVSFVDFAPTMLSLCGVKPPERFQGAAFAGRFEGLQRAYVHGARDRVDEAFDVARSVRSQQFLYIRNYMPHLPWMQPESFSDGSSFRRELKRMAAAGHLPTNVLGYANPRRMEEFYDLEIDPHQLRNLAGDPSYRSEQNELRAELRRWQMESRDTGFFTEPQIWKRIGAAKTPREYAQSEKDYPLVELLNVANSVGTRGTSLLDELASPHDAIRYWAAVVLNARNTFDAKVRVPLLKALDDASAVVRIEAASLIARKGDAGERTQALKVLTEALKDEMPEVVLHAARAVELLGPIAAPVKPAMQATLETARAAEARGENIPMFIRFSLEAALRP